MIKLASSIFSCGVMHRRYRPKRHELRYATTSLFVDVDEMQTLSQASWLFGYQSKKLFSLQDRHHGPGDGTPIAQHARSAMKNIKTQHPVKRIYMLCYPAVLGFVFNPLTVYFGFADDDQLVAIIYEVNNTFGERHSYALPVEEGRDHHVQKALYVSPFNPVEGEYRFSCHLETGHLRLSIALFEAGALKLCARMEGDRKDFGDLVLLRGLASLAFQPVKVLAGIHWEALKLFVKGLRPVPRPPHAKFTLSNVESRK